MANMVWRNWRLSTVFLMHCSCGGELIFSVLDNPELSFNPACSSSFWHSPTNGVGPVMQSPGPLLAQYYWSPAASSYGAYLWHQINAHRGGGSQTSQKLSARRLTKRPISTRAIVWLLVRAAGFPPPRSEFRS